jgi:hypothetical protein
MGRIDSLRKTDQEAGGRQNSEFRIQNSGARSQEPEVCCLNKIRILFSAIATDLRGDIAGECDAGSPGSGGASPYLSRSVGAGSWLLTPDS